MENADPPVPLQQAPLPLRVLQPGPVDFWFVPASIALNNFIHKSLSNWAFNIAVGCSHACRFCYVPDASAISDSTVDHLIFIFTQSINPH